MLNVYIKILSYFFVFIFYILIKSLDAKDMVTINHVHQNCNTLEYLDINKAFMLALANNSDIRIVTSRLKQVEHKMSQFESYYWPSIDLKGALITTDDNLRTNNFYDNTYELGLKASWVFFNGFKTKFQNIMVNYDNQIAYEDVAKTSRLLLVNVSRSFYKAQLTLEKIRITKADEVFNKRLLYEAQIKHNAGASPLSDVLNFEIRLNNAEVKRNKEENDYKVAMNNLASLLEISDSSFTSRIILTPFSSETEEELIMPDLDSLIEVALEHHPEVKMKKLLVKQINANIYANIADKYPELSVSTQIFAKKTGNMKFSDDNISCVISANLSYNVFNGGFNAARIRELKERENELKYEVQRYLFSIRTEIKNAVLKISNAQTKVAYQRKNTNLVGKVRNLVEKEYFANTNSLVRLNEAQSNLIRSQGQLAIALSELKQAWIELKLLTGEQIYHSTF